jgi:transposase-like protein
MISAPAVPAPPFCPNPECRFHRADKHLWRFVKLGFYTRSVSPRRVQRFRCVSCRRHFSEQTFRTTYWMHRPQILPAVFHRLNACSGFRQIARELRVSPSTVARASDRLGRHALLFHQRLRPRGPLREPLALDGFESFEFSQYYPTSYHIAAGQRSHFFYGFTESECRRRGTMTRFQKWRRGELEGRLGRPDPKSIEKAVAALLAILAPEPGTMELHTDEHKSYPRAVRRLPHLGIAHHTISSRAARIPQNPLFAINLLDLLIRHNGANCKRETVAFSKRRASAALRLALFLVWRNYVQPFSERKRGPTPAVRLGLADRRFTVEDVLARRLFITQSDLPERWRDYYWRRLPTRAIPNGRQHQLKYAT